MAFGTCNLSGNDFVLDFIRCTFNFADAGQGSIMGLGILFAGMFALYILGKSTVGHARALSASLFVGTIASFIMATLDLVSSKITWICVALFILSLFFLERETGEQ